MSAVHCSQVKDTRIHCNSSVHCSQVKDTRIHSISALYCSQVKDIWIHYKSAVHCSQVKDTRIHCMSAVHCSQVKDTRIHREIFINVFSMDRSLKIETFFETLDFLINSHYFCLYNNWPSILELIKKSNKIVNISTSGLDFIKVALKLRNNYLFVTFDKMTGWNKKDRKEFQLSLDGFKFTLNPSNYKIICFSIKCLFNVWYKSIKKILPCATSDKKELLSIWKRWFLINPLRLLW